MDKIQIEKLTRVLGLLSSDQAGERAAAALAASRMIEQAGTSWNELLQRREPAGRRRREYGIDYEEAAEARMRQLRASNKALEAEVTRLRNRVNRMAEEARRAYYDDGEEELSSL